MHLKQISIGSCAKILERKQILRISGCPQHDFFLQTRSFGRRNNRRDQENKARKKKFFSERSPSGFAQPDKGLILPPKGVILEEDSQEHNTRIVNSLDNNDSSFQPLVDDGLKQADTLRSELMDENLDMNLSKSLSSPSLPDMIDLSSMYDPRIHLPLKPNFADPSKNYEPATLLGEELMKYIGVLGAPITVAEYMKRCLRDERFGYYTNPPSSIDDDFDDDNFDNDGEGRGHRLIGQGGDFTTAPEISQIFGECLTIWLLTQYEAIGKPSKIQLIELGPGRGTLMSDIIRSAKNIKGPGHEFINALSADGTVGENGTIGGVHFVEVSENLRVTQREALQKLQESSDIKFTFIQWKSQDEKMKDMEQIMSKLREKKNSGENVDTETLAKILEEETKRKYESENIEQIATASSSSIPVHWHDNLNSVPYKKASGSSQSIPTFIIGQEFLDALPVHVFQKSEQGWREHMVDVAVEDDEDDEDKVEVQMRDGTIAKTSTMKSSKNSSTDDDTKKKPRFRHVLSPGVTPALRNLLRIDDDGKPMGTSEQRKLLDDAPEGTIMEVCPEGLSLIQDVALRIEECRGAALMIDYGNEGSRDTLRAFRKHEQVEVLSSPGTVDLTADVDFSALKNAVNRDLSKTREKMTSSKSLGSADNLPQAFGPKTQGAFLASMGAVERTIKLIEDDNTTDEQAEDLCAALERLVSEEEMGTRFKVLAIAHKKDGIFAPAGF